eukprot:285637-Alexandrium_andersonii.AAC.1
MVSSNSERKGGCADPSRATNPKPISVPRSVALPRTEWQNEGASGYSKWIARTTLRSLCVKEA